MDILYLQIIVNLKILNFDLNLKFFKVVLKLNRGWHRNLFGRTTWWTHIKHFKL